jgi:hypothetical protein
MIVRVLLPIVMLLYGNKKEQIINNEEITPKTAQVAQEDFCVSLTF